MTATTTQKNAALNALEALSKKIDNLQKLNGTEAQVQGQNILTMVNSLIHKFDSTMAGNAAMTPPQTGSPKTKKTAKPMLPTPANSKEGSTTPTGTPPKVNSPNNTNNTGNTLASTLPQKRPLAAEDYQLRMGSGWTVSDGLFEHQPDSKRRRRDVPFPPNINYSYRSMYGLSTLQISADSPISMCAMDVACDHIWKCLPEEVRAEAMIAPPNGPAIWSNDKKARELIYRQMGLAVYMDDEGDGYLFYADLKRKQWVVWPIWVEDEWGSDWVTICWRATPSDAEKPKVYDHLSAYCIIDPRREPLAGPDGRHAVLRTRSRRIEARLHEFLRNGGYHTSSAMHYDTLGSPMLVGEHSSGERCFAAVKELCNHICDWYFDGTDEQKFGFVNLSKWVNPYQQRIEMTGINAWVLMGSFDYGARIAVEAVLPNSRVYVTANGEKRMIVPYDLAGPYEEPPIASSDFLLPPNGKYAMSTSQTPKNSPKPTSGWGGLAGLF